MKGFIFIYLMTAAGTIGSIVNPLIGLFVYVLFSILRPHYLWGFAGDLGGISQYVGVAMLVSWGLRGGGNWRIGRAWAPVALLVLFNVWAAVSTIQALNYTIAYDWVIELLKVVLPVLVGATLLDDPKHQRWMLYLIVIAQGYVAYEMNAAYFFDGYNRAQDSGFGGMDNNSFAISLVTALGPALAMILVSKQWPLKAVAAFFSVMILHCILLTFSRGALLGLLTSGFAGFFILPKRPRYLALFIVAGLLLIRLIGPQLYQRYTTINAEEGARDTSAESRVQLWSACWDLVKKNPIFGIGPRNFPVVAAQYGFTSGKEAHSVWMQTAAEMGIPGVGFLAFFYLTTLAGLWPLARARITDDNREQALIAMGVMVGILGFMVSGQFVSLTGLEIPYYVAMIGVAMVKTRTRVQSPSEATAASAVGTGFDAAAHKPLPGLRWS